MTGKLPEGVTATDLVLTVTQMLREKGVVGKFVEFYGQDWIYRSQTVPPFRTWRRSTVQPVFFPVDEETINYACPAVTMKRWHWWKHSKEQGLWRSNDNEPLPIRWNWISVPLPRRLQDPNVHKTV